MTQQQLDAAVQLSNRISELRQRLLVFDRSFTLDGTGQINLYAKGGFLAKLDFETGMPPLPRTFWPHTVATWPRN